MRCLPRALGAAATIAAACASLPAGALAGAGAASSGTGGAAAAPAAAQEPSTAHTGGSQYGRLTGARAAPVVSVFEVPATIVAGKPPTVRLRVDSAHAGTVRVKVVVYQASAREPLIAIDMGWVRTGHTFTVSWPRGTRLAAGSYHLAVGVHGHRSGPARAFAHTSRAAQLNVTAPATTPPAVAPQVPAGVPTPAQSAALGAVFPVAGTHNFGGPENRFGAPRAGHIHDGQDILTAEGSPIVAPLAGTVITTGYQASAAGYYAAEHTAAGLDFFFAHCKAESLLVKTDESVAAGQQLCAAGQTGDATTPHLHFEIWFGGWRAQGGYAVDPLPYLEAWERKAG
jgi:biotin carboxyl carrier protein